MTTPDKGTRATLTPITYLILIALASESRHGYGIIKRIERLTEGEVCLAAGSLYAAIKRLSDLEWIEVVPRRPDEDPRRVRYALTPQGLHALRMESRRLEALLNLARAAAVLPAVDAKATE